MQIEVVEAVTITVAVLSFLVAFVSFWNTSKKDASKEAQDSAEAFADMRTRSESQFAGVNAKLEAIGDSLEDIKDDVRGASDEISSVRSTAERALSRADEAHKRLDRAGINGKAER